MVTTPSHSIYLEGMLALGVGSDPKLRNRKTAQTSPAFSMEVELTASPANAVIARSQNLRAF